MSMTKCYQRSFAAAALSMGALCIGDPIFSTENSVDLIGTNPSLPSFSAVDLVIRTSDGADGLPTLDATIFGASAVGIDGRVVDGLAVFDFRTVVIPQLLPSARVTGVRPMVLAAQNARLLGTPPADATFGLQFPGTSGVLFAGTGGGVGGTGGDGRDGGSPGTRANGVGAGDGGTGGGPLSPGFAGDDGPAGEAATPGTRPPAPELAEDGHPGFGQSPAESAAAGARGADGAMGSPGVGGGAGAGGAGGAGGEGISCPFVCTGRDAEPGARGGDGGDGVPGGHGEDGQPGEGGRASDLGPEFILTGGGGGAGGGGGGSGGAGVPFGRR